MYHACFQTSLKYCGLNVKHFKDPCIECLIPKAAMLRGGAFTRSSGHKECLGECMNVPLEAALSGGSRLQVRNPGGHALVPSSLSVPPGCPKLRSSSLPCPSAMMFVSWSQPASHWLNLWNWAKITLFSLQLCRLCILSQQQKWHVILLQLAFYTQSCFQDSDSCSTLPFIYFKVLNNILFHGFIIFLYTEGHLENVLFFTILNTFFNEYLVYIFLCTYAWIIFKHTHTTGKLLILNSDLPIDYFIANIWPYQILLQ